MKSSFKITFCFIAVMQIFLIFFSLFQSLHINNNKCIQTSSACDCDNDSIDDFITNIFTIKSKALLTQDLDCFSCLYDLNTTYGKYAYEYEEKKVKYLKNWSEKQGVTFTNISPIISISKKSKVNGDKADYYVFCRTCYSYIYNNDKDNTENKSYIGTFHVLNLKKHDDEWIITKEWYKDPFGDSLTLANIKSQDIREFILNYEKKENGKINEFRKKAVEYAHFYCGASTDKEDFYRYNTKYKNFNSEGGDCANFASQILTESGKFKKTGGWTYDKGSPSAAWVNAGAFTHYMLYSGRASLIAKGSYNEVYKSSYKLLPGDIVAYEKKNDITHVSVVTASDSKGYALVTCHNTDRNDVPWDLGWSDKNIKFFLIRVHF